MRKPAESNLTKIIATIGPACADPAVLGRMIEEGFRVARINFSHGGFEDFEASLAAVREASAEAGVPVGVLGDLSGPKIRLRKVAGEPVTLGLGDSVELSRADGPSRRYGDTGVTVLTTTYPPMIDEVQPGHRVLIDDGAVRMLAVEKRHAPDDGDDRLVCRVTTPGPIRSSKGVNLPDSAISAPSLTDWDRRCVAWAVEHELDFLALSFVRRAEDVAALKAVIRELLPPAAAARRGARLPVIAKIEKPQALDELEGIFRESDGVMVARGDLGVEMDLAEVPVLQKRIIRAGHEHGKPVIVATQMLQSMIEQASPTRAEVSDVANAIMDGADAVMLSGETAVGKFPVPTVRMMARTAVETERYAATTPGVFDDPGALPGDSKYRTAALARGVSVVARDLGARYVVVWSEMGGGARYLSRHRLPVPVIAVSSSRWALRQMSLMFGITAIAMRRPASVDAFVGAVDELLLGRDWAEPGDAVVVVAGEPLGTPGVTNKLRIHYVGDVCRMPAGGG